MSDQFFTPRFELQSPYVGDYFGLWMIEPRYFQNVANQYQGANLHLHLQSSEIQQRVRSSDERSFLLSSDGIAGFMLSGPMMKSVPSMADGTSYVRMTQQLNQARRDPAVFAGLISGDTPGGTSKGNEDFASAVAKFSAVKPLFYFVEDMTASAGVSIASQATKIYANNATAMYGAMGTYGVIQDMSGMAEKLGIKVHVIRAGDFKGAGVPGTEVTEQQLEELQREVNIVNENYLSIIAKGLKKPIGQIRELADGRVIMASDAVSAGLIDGIQSLEETTAELRAMVASINTTSVHVNRSDSTMADKIPATLQELKQTFPNSSAEWRETQQLAGHEISQAAISYASFLETKMKASEDAHKQAIEDAKKSAAPLLMTGHQPLTTSNVADGGDIDSGDAVQDFNAAVAAKLPKGRTATWSERQNAIAFVARANPALHQAYIASGNQGTRAKRLLEEKYEAAK